MDLQYLIENFDNLIIYFIPASAFMLTFKLFARYSSQTKLLSAETIVLSYIMTSVIRYFNPSASVVAILAIALIAGIICALIKNSRWVEEQFKKKFQKVYWDNIWYGITDYKYGTYLHVYIDGTDISYRGAFRDDYTDEAGHRWIVLSNYRMFKGFDESGENSENLITVEDFRKDDTKRVAIDTTKVCRAEIRYHKDSVKIK